MINLEKPVAGALIGTLVASNYQSTLLRGFNLPLLPCSSHTTRWTNAILIATEIFSEFDNYQEGIPKHLEQGLLLPNESGSSFNFTYSDLLIMIGLTQALIGSDKGTPDYTKSLLPDGATIDLSSIFSTLKVLGMNESKLVEPVGIFKLISDLTIDDLRSHSLRHSPGFGILAGVYAGINTAGFEKALRMCLYIGGCRSISLPIAAAAAATRGYSIPSSMTFLCKSKIESAWYGSIT